MLHCDEVCRIIHLYIDEELHGTELAHCEAHLETCTHCRNLLNRERRWSSAMKTRTPLYDAPPALRNAIEQMVRADIKDDYQQKAPAALRRKVEQLLWRNKINSYLRSPWLKIAAMLIIVVIIGGIFWPSPISVERSNAFAMMAVNSHLRRQKGNLPLEVTSDSPQMVTTWFANKLIFNFKLPNYEAPPDHPKPYILEGARLVGFDKDYAAYVSYKMQDRLISLVVTAADQVQPAGGETIMSQNINFHFHTINGLKVITWTDNGLTYALVSDLAERGQASCIVCHQDKQQKIIAPFETSAKH